MCDLVTDNTSEATNLPQHAIFIRGVDHAYNFTETSVSSNIKRHEKSRDFHRAEKNVKAILSFIVNVSSTVPGVTL